MDVYYSLLSYLPEVREKIKSYKTNQVFKFFKISFLKSLRVICNPLPLHPIRKNGF